MATISRISAGFGTDRTRERRRPAIKAAAIAFASFGLLGFENTASASLLGAQVSYQSLFPNTQTILSNLGTQTVGPLTSFTDSQNGITSFFIGNQLVVENTSPLAFATAAFNGPQFTFSNGGLTGASVGPDLLARFPRRPLLDGQQRPDELLGADAGAGQHDEHSARHPPAR